MHRRSQACRVNAKADSGLLGTTIGRRTMFMGRLTFVILMGSLFAAPAVAESRAAAYLAKQEINDGCDGRQGRIDPAGLIERDLDGDGMPDLIISHEAIRCAGKNFTEQSLRHAGLLRTVLSASRIIAPEGPRYAGCQRQGRPRAHPEGPYGCPWRRWRLRSLEWEVF